jgi:uncharacterized protein
MTRTDRVVVVMAKAPVAGKAKTRLIPRLGADQAARLYRHMLLDTLDLVAEALDGSGAISIVCPTTADRAALQQIVPREIQIVADEQGSLMGGLNYALTSHTDQGYHQVILLDGDSPTLPMHYLRSAFVALDSSDVVLGPTLDGGYYLIGARKPQPMLFAWEHLDSATLCRQTQQRAEVLGQRVAVLPAWYDIDTPDDLAHLVGDLRSQTAQARGTHRFLEQIGYL